MSTINHLLNDGTLISWEPFLKSHEQKLRLLYLAPELDDWIGEILQPAPVVKKHVLSPFEETETLLDSYARGEKLQRGGVQKLIKSTAVGQHVWEFKPDGVRVFGYFYRPRFFVAVCADFKEAVKGNYGPYIEKVIAYRASLPLTPIPTHETLDEINDLL